MVTKEDLHQITYEVVGAAIEVHKIVGPGLLESVYHQCMKEELSRKKLHFVTEFKIPLVYKEKKLEADFRCDLLVEECLVVELKSVKEMSALFECQLLTYMRLLKAPKGILINFNCKNIFYEGQQTYVNQYFEKLL